MQLLPFLDQFTNRASPSKSNRNLVTGLVSQDSAPPHVEGRRREKNPPKLWTSGVRRVNTEPGFRVGIGPRPSHLKSS